MTTFLLRLEPEPGDGTRVAVKDLIDVRGTPTTAACRPVAATARPAAEDAACVAAIRSNGGRIVGKTNLHELAFGGSGVNPYTGTPVNPLDPRRVPGGSSSGSAVAVATGEADVALGTDTAGSIRTPSACCGVVGLKTTFGRISCRGVQPLAPSLDTVGPMAATVAGVVRGMTLLDPGFQPAAQPAPVIGRFHLTGTDPSIEAAIDRALAAAGPVVEPCHLAGWDAADEAGGVVLFAEAAAVHRQLFDDHAAELGPETRDRLERGRRISPERLAAALDSAGAWRAELDAALDRTSVIALAAILDEPPPLTDPLRVDTRRPNVAVNLAGNPAIVVPLPRRGRFPTAVQLVGRHDDEELLVTTAAAVEAAAGPVR